MSRAKFYHLSPQQLRTASRNLQEHAVLMKTTPAVRREARRLGIDANQLKVAVLRWRLNRRRYQLGRSAPWQTHA